MKKYTEKLFFIYGTQKIESGSGLTTYLGSFVSDRKQSLTKTKKELRQAPIGVTPFF